MNNLVLRSKMINLSISGMISENLEQLDSHPDTVSSFFEGMNILYFSDTNLWEKIYTLSYTENKFANLFFIYKLGSSFHRFINDPHNDWNIVGRDFSTGYTGSNVRLLRFMGHPLFQSSVHMYVPSRGTVSYDIVEL